MGMRFEHERANFTAELTASNEKIKLIRKLRWLGLEAEALKLEKELEHRASADTVIAVHGETD
jgi:hypothetical protein